MTWWVILLAVVGGVVVGGVVGAGALMIYLAKGMWQ